MRGILVGAAVVSFVACGSGGASTSEPGDAGGSDGAHASHDGGSSSSGSGSSSGKGSSSGSGSGSGASSSGSSSGGSGSGGSSSGAHADGGGGTDASTATGPCKRGIGSSGTPPAALAPSASQPGVSWWYDWSNKNASPPAGVEFVPMIWGTGSDGGPIPSNAKFLLGFNEPNFKAQSNLTPAQAAAAWPKVEALANGAGIPLVSPAVNFCGSASNPSGCSDPSVTDPYTWLKDFFAACPGCKVDYVAVHWYNCDLPSLQGYLEGNGSGLEGFVQFGKPLWLTEFSCGPSSTPAQQKAYMQAAVPYLEGNAHVYRYSWFSSTAIASAELTNADGTLTDLGATYVSLPQACH